jgi:hypothetical protein
MNETVIPMRTLIPLFFFVMLASCSNDDAASSMASDSLTAKDSLKKAISEDLPPPSDIRQFNWFYSAFTHAAVTGDDSLFNTFIHPKHGLWVIHSEGAVPSFTKVQKIGDYKLTNGKGLLPLDRDKMLAEPKEGELPKIDCDQEEFWNKTGCFTTEHNVFLEEKIWQAAGLKPADDKQVAYLATTIARTVINTSTYRFYFSLIDGGWYLTFIDIRKPCSA